MRPEPDLQEHNRLITRALVQNLARRAERMAAQVDRMTASVDWIDAQLDRIDARMCRIEDRLIGIAEAFRAYCENEQRRGQ